MIITNIVLVLSNKCSLLASWVYLINFFSFIWPFATLRFVSLNFSLKRQACKPHLVATIREWFVINIVQIIESTFICLTFCKLDLLFSDNLLVFNIFNFLFDFFFWLYKRLYKNGRFARRLHADALWAIKRRFCSNTHLWCPVFLDA